MYGSGSQLPNLRGHAQAGIVDLSPEGQSCWFYFSRPLIAGHSEGPGDSLESPVGVNFRVPRHWDTIHLVKSVVQGRSARWPRIFGASHNVFLAKGPARNVCRSNHAGQRVSASNCPFLLSWNSVEQLIDQPVPSVRSWPGRDEAVEHARSIDVFFGIK
jgi:hypothetical protein